MKTKYINFIRKTIFGSVAIPMFGARVANGLFRKTGNRQWSLTPLIFSLSALTLAVCLQATPAYALLSVEDGADSQTEAAAEAYNNSLLSGPDEGQSNEDWVTELQEEHDVLYGAGTGLEELLGGDGGVGTADNALLHNALDPVDLCQSPVSLWMTSDSDTRVADAIVEPSVRAKLIQHLEDYTYGLLYLELWVRNVYIQQPKILNLSCKGNKSDLSIKIPAKIKVPLNKKSDGFTLLSGEITSLHASVSSTEINDPTVVLPYEWCMNIHPSYNITGFGFLGLANPAAHLWIDPVLSKGLFCNYAWHWDN